jgi:hypothetical protein
MINVFPNKQTFFPRIVNEIVENMNLSFAPGTFLRVRADYQSNGAWDSLTVDAGDSVEVSATEEQRPGWIKVINRCLGPRNGEEGWIEESCVELDGNASAQGPEPSHDPSAGLAVEQQPSQLPLLTLIAPWNDEGASTYAPQVFDDTESHQDPTSGTGPSSNTSAPPGNEVQPGTKVIVQYDFEATKGDELDLHEGEAIFILASPPGGWWRGMSGYGSKDSKAGWFPANLVEVTQEQSPPISKSKQPPSSNASATDQNKRRLSWFKKVTSANTSKGALEQQKRARSWSVDGASERPQNSPNEKSLAAVPEDKNEIQILVGAGTSAGQRLSLKPLTAMDKRTRSMSTSLLEVSPQISPYLSISNHDVSQLSPSRSEPKSWRDRVSPETLESMKLNEKKRQDAIWELITTEQDYVRDIKIIVEVRAQYFRRFPSDLIGIHAPFARTQDFIWKSRQ